MNFPPLTYTFLSNFENCPRKAKALYVDKRIPRGEPSEAQARGTWVHKELDHRLAAGADRHPLKGDMVPYEKYAAAIDDTVARHNLVCKTETGIAISTHFLEVDYWGQAVWMRGKPDVTLVSRDGKRCVTFDWKTGSSKYEDPFELQVQALLLKGRYPRLEQIKGSYVWLKENRWGKMYDLSDMAVVLERIGKTTRAMDADDWEPRPNPLCGWCPVLDCEHNRSRG